MQKIKSLNYLTHKQPDFKDNKTLLQLRDCIIAVADNKNKIATCEMFNTELNFAADCLLKWFDKKFKSNNLEFSNNLKRKYEIEHPINWSQDRCCLCPFTLKINPTSYEADEKIMSYIDFIIFKEHKFLRNIFSSPELGSFERFKNIS